MRFVILAVLLTFTPVMAEEMVSIPRRLLNDTKAKIAKLKQIEDATPYVTIKGIEVVQDAQGRVFIKDTAEVTIKLAMLEYQDDATIKAKVKQHFVKSKEPFVSRFGLLAAYDFDLKADALFKQAVYLTYAIFRYRRVGLEAATNAEKYGIGLSHKLTPNTKLMVGANWRYSQKSNPAPFIGVGFNF
jgi:hypothetical protein